MHFLQNKKVFWLLGIFESLLLHDVTQTCSEQFDVVDGQIVLCFISIC